MPERIAPAPDADKSAVTGTLVACSVEAAHGHANAALLLMRILFWMPIEKSGAGWAAEIGLTERGMALLPNRGQPARPSPTWKRNWGAQGGVTANKEKA